MDHNPLHNITYGLYILSSNKGEKLNGMAHNALFQVTSKPPTLASSINKKHLTHECIEASGRYTISILDQSTPLKFIGKFGFRSGREIDKFKGTEYRLLDSGVPVITENALGYLEVKVTDKVSCGTHTIFIGEIVGSATIREGIPLTYDYYHQVKHGTTPESAPTYIKEEHRKTGGKKMDSYVCQICGYIYNPENGDPENGVAAGTPFEQLPDDWVCPICGASKDDFEKEA
jgi:flavin reductase (DIM6/NTAB) family NADH-FMN oxidoreductase RutF/rubredoxin